MRKFVKAMGLYTREEMEDPAFDALPILTPFGFQMDEFWRSISRESSFRASKSKASLLMWGSHRVFHYLLARTLNSKMDSAGAVTKKDILPLYSVVNQYRVNVGVLVAFSIKHQAGTKMRGIFVGQMITRILKNLKLWPTNPSLQPKEEGIGSKGITHDPFHQWGTPRVADPLFDAEAPGVLPPPPSQTSFSVGNLTKIEADISDIKKKQDLLLDIFKKIAESMNVDISSCFAGNQTRDIVLVEEAPTPPLLEDPLEGLDLDGLKCGVRYFTSEEEMEEEEEEESSSGSENSHPEEENSEEGEEEEEEEEGDEDSSSDSD